MDDLKCPFCGGNGKAKFKQYKFYGKNCNGDKKISYRVSIQCCRCHADGPPVITEPLIDPFPLVLIRGNPDPLLYPEKEWIEEDRRQWEMFKPYIVKANELWDRRCSDGL